MEETAKWIMLTLTIKKEKEMLARKMLMELEAEIATEGALIVTGGSGAEHYHILHEGDALDKLDLKNWPGHVKKHNLTKTQAEHVKQTHPVCYLAGLRQEGQ